MKIETHNRMVTTVELEGGETLGELWKALGGTMGGGWPVTIVNGVITATQPSYRLASVVDDDDYDEEDDGW